MNEMRIPSGTCRHFPQRHVPRRALPLWLLTVLLVALMAGLLPGSAPMVLAAKKSETKTGATETQAADTTGKETQAAEKKTGWKRTDQGYIFRDQKGKKVKPASGKKYLLMEHKRGIFCFNSKGIQVHGWRKINGKYYYFALGHAYQGGMVKDATIYGIRIRKDGTASPKTARAKRKMILLARYSEWLDEILKDHRNDKKSQKRKVIFDYLRNLPYRNVGHLRKTDKNRDLWGAEYVYKARSFDCHTIASTFAYMALSIGYDRVEVQSLSWHSFVKINDLYYDPSLARHHKKSYKLYAMKKYYKATKYNIDVSK